MAVPNLSPVQRRWADALRYAHPELSERDAHRAVHTWTATLLEANPAWDLRAIEEAEQAWAAAKLKEEPHWDEASISRERAERQLLNPLGFLTDDQVTEMLGGGSVRQGYVGTIKTGSYEGCIYAIERDPDDDKRRIVKVGRETGKSPGLLIASVGSDASSPPRVIARRGAMEVDETELRRVAGWSSGGVIQVK